MRPDIEVETEICSLHGGAVAIQRLGTGLSEYPYRVPVKFNTLDETLILSDLETVYDTMIREFGGGKRWWTHLWESEPTGNLPITQPGGSINITVHDIIDGKFSARTVCIKEYERLDIEFFSGDFTGTAIWRWITEGNATRVSQEWHASPNSLKFQIASRMIDIEKIHSKVIQGGFTALNNYLQHTGRI